MESLTENTLSTAALTYIPQPYGAAAAAGIKLYSYGAEGFKKIKDMFTPANQWEPADQAAAVAHDARITMLYGPSLGTEIINRLTQGMKKENMKDIRRVYEQFVISNEVEKKLKLCTENYYQTKILTEEIIVTAPDCAKAAPKNGGQTEHDQVNRFNIILEYLCRDRKASYVYCLNGNASNEAWKTKYLAYDAWFRKNAIYDYLETIPGIAQGLGLMDISKIESILGDFDNLEAQGKEKTEQTNVSAGTVIKNPVKAPNTEKKGVDLAGVNPILIMGLAAAAIMMYGGKK